MQKKHSYHASSPAKKRNTCGDVLRLNFATGWSIWFHCHGKKKKKGCFTCA